MSLASLLKEEKNFLNTIINNMMQGTITIDKNGVIMSFNKRAEDIFLYQVEDVIGKNVSVLMPDPDRKNHDSYISNYTSSRSPKVIGIGRDVTGLRKTGEDFPMHLTVTETHIGDETVFIGLILDMSEQIEREEILKKAKEEADTANQAKSGFLANMSHELRTPLNSILGLARMFVEDPELTQDNKEMAQTIYKSATNLLENVNEILDISKIESGNMELEQISFSFTDVISNVVETTSPIARENGIFLHHFYLTENIPQLIGDPFRLNLILTNFISNAMKYMHDGDIDVFKNGEEDIEIIIKANSLGDNKIEIHCAVNDTGIGIAKDKLDSIFDKFTQADLSTTRKFGGTGLGLAITKDLVTRMDGEIGVDSKIGEGSSFWFKIPFSITDKADETGKNNIHCERRKRKRERNDTKTPFKKARVLVVEDHLLNQDFIRRLLKRMGFQNVDIADNGLFALQFYENNNYDLILMDCHMPEKNGYETTIAIRQSDRENAKTIPIIALTADAMKGTKEKCLAAGMNDYVTKPIDSDELKNVLEQWVIFTNSSQLKPLGIKDKEVDAPVDMNVLKEYAETDEDIADFAEIFLTQSEESIEILKENCSSGENTQWRESAHKLKGGSSMFGASKLYEICAAAQEMETASADQRHVMTDDIIQEYSAIKEYLDNYLAKIVKNRTIN